MLDANGLVEVTEVRRADGSGSSVNCGDATHQGGGRGQSFLVDYIVSCKIILSHMLFVYLYKCVVQWVRRGIIM